MIAGIARVLRRLRGDNKGNVLLMAGAALTGLIGAAGLGVDTVQWYLWKRQLQQAVDTGSVAGAIALTYGRDHSAAVTSDVALNRNTPYTIEAINTPPTSGGYAGQLGAVEVIATTQQRLPFSSLFLINAPTIRTRAVATAIGVGEPCVLSLAQTGIGVDVFGSADVQLGCPIASNSVDGVSLDVNGSAYVDSQLIMSAGGINYGSNNLPSDASIVPYGLPVEDPLASRTFSFNKSTCNYTNEKVLPSQTRTLNPGVYCGGLTIQGTALLNGGQYIIRGGSLRINSGADVSLAGTGGVTFIMTGTNSNTVAEIDIRGGANVDLTAPTESESTMWEGMLFYQDPIGSATHQINGSAGVNLNGIIYLNQGDLTYNGDSSQTAQCLLIVTERVNFGGTNKIENDKSKCPDYLTDFAPEARVIRVVE